MKVKFDLNREEEKAREIIADYERRKEKKRAYEESWLLNINFLLGNQHSYILPNGEVGEKAKSYPYESREVFNHIAPIVESRLAKLGKVRPKVAVRPASSSEKDEGLAKLSRQVLDAISVELSLPDIIKRATLWSEVTGTVFYKVVINDAKNRAGRLVDVHVVSPFELFPSDLGVYDDSEVESFIHARGISRSEAEAVYGERDYVEEQLSSLSLDLASGGAYTSGASNVFKMAGGEAENKVLVLERYSAPSKENPKGVLEIVVGGQLVYEGELPFGVMPFVRQVSTLTIGSYLGTSIVDRCIPVQRAYNAVKNRKIEYLGRLSAGVALVEEGSVDVDDLVEEGLAPGKVVVYRSGSNIPRLMDSFSIPPELSREEDRLLNELISLTGVSELMRNSTLPSNVTSGTAINLLSEADDNRLSVAAEHIRNSLLRLSKLILVALKAVAADTQISRVFDSRGKAQLVYWKGSDLLADDIVLDTENELSDSITQRRSMVLDLVKTGLLNSGRNGEMDERTRSKILDMIGFGSYESAHDVLELHVERARAENHYEKRIVYEIDDHNVHIEEHTRYILENDSLDEKARGDMFNHIREHKAFLDIEPK